MVVFFFFIKFYLFFFLFLGFFFLGSITFELTFSLGHRLFNHLFWPPYLYRHAALTHRSLSPITLFPSSLPFPVFIFSFLFIYLFFSFLLLCRSIGVVCDRLTIHCNNHAKKKGFLRICPAINDDTGNYLILAWKLNFPARFFDNRSIKFKIVRFRKNFPRTLENLFSTSPKFSYEFAIDVFLKFFLLFCFVFYMNFEAFRVRLTGVQIFRWLSNCRTFRFSRNGFIVTRILVHVQSAVTST